MRAADAIGRMEDALYRHWGILAIHRPKNGDPVQRRVIVSRGVERQGDEIGVMVRSDELTVLTCEGPRPLRGDTFGAEDRTWTVDGEVISDGTTTTVRVR
jgi:hypothetical protein